MQRVRVGRVGTTSRPVSGGEGGVERVAGTGGGLGGPNASSVGWYSKDVSVGGAVGIGRGGAGRRGYRPRYQCGSAHCSGDVTGKVRRL